MELGTLKKWRLFVPGLLLLVLAKVLLSNSATGLFELKKFIESINLEAMIYLVPILLFGIAYYICNVRWLLWKGFNKEVTDNIDDKLVAPIASSALYGDVKKMCGSGKVKRIFYDLIDNDPSLKEKSNLVRFNGLIWTSCMDISIISFFGATYFFIKWTIQKIDFNAFGGIILLGISIIFYLALYPLTKKHIKLSDEQLTQIIDLHKEKLMAKLK